MAERTTQELIKLVTSGLDMAYEGGYQDPYADQRVACMSGKASERLKIGTSEARNAEFLAEVCEYARTKDAPHMRDFEIYDDFVPAILADRITGEQLHGMFQSATSAGNFSIKIIDHGKNDQWTAYVTSPPPAIDEQNDTVITLNLTGDIAMDAGFVEARTNRAATANNNARTLAGNEALFDSVRNNCAVNKLPVIDGVQYSASLCNDVGMAQALREGLVPSSTPSGAPTPTLEEGRAAVR